MLFFESVTMGMKETPRKTACFLLFLQAHVSRNSLGNCNKKLIGDNFYFHVALIFKRELDNDSIRQKETLQVKCNSFRLENVLLWHAINKLTKSSN